MGHLQPPTPIKIDNTTVLGVVINIIKRKCTKAVNIRFHWLTGRQKTNILYGYTYTRALDGTILTALNSIGTMQSKSTQATKTKVHHLLDYLSTYPTFVVTYKASDMIIHVDIGASYLVESGAKVEQ